MQAPFVYSFDAYFEELQFVADVGLIPTQAVERFDHQGVPLSEDHVFQCLVAWPVQALSAFLVRYDFSFLGSHRNKGRDLAVEVLLFPRYWRLPPAHTQLYHTPKC